MKAKRNAQEAPIAVQVKGAQEFVDRAQKRLDSRQVARIAEGQAKLQRLRKQVEEEAKSPPAVPEPPPEWVSEIHRLRSEVGSKPAPIDPSGILSKPQQNVELG